MHFTMRNIKHLIHIFLPAIMISILVIATFLLTGLLTILRVVLSAL